MNKKFEYSLSYDECDIIDDETKYHLEENIFEGKTKEEVRSIISNTPEIFESAWLDFKLCLSEYLSEIDKNESHYFKVVGKNLGWRHLEGYKILRANNGEELLKGVLPKTCEFSLYVKKMKTQLIIKCTHHDAPTGEYYFIKPLTKKELREKAKCQD